MSLNIQKEKWFLQYSCSFTTKSARGEGDKILALAVHTAIQVYENDPPTEPNAKMSLLCDLKVTICKMGMEPTIPVLKSITFVK